MFWRYSVNEVIAGYQHLEETLMAEAVDRRYSADPVTGCGQ